MTSRVFRLSDAPEPADGDAGESRWSTVGVERDAAVEWGINPIDIGANELRQAFEVNVFGAVSMTKAAIRSLREGGRVVNMSSPLGSLTLLSDPNSPVSSQRLLAYNSSKAALNALTLMYAAELHPRGVLVNAASPGLVGTDLNGLTPGADGVRTVQEGAQVPVQLALLPPNGPTGRFFGNDQLAPDGVVPW